MAKKEEEKTKTPEEEVQPDLTREQETKLLQERLSELKLQENAEKLPEKMAELEKKLENIEERMIEVQDAVKFIGSRVQSKK